MNFLQIIGKMFGNKYEKDVKNIMPIVDKINIIYTELQTINNDQLRKNTQDLNNSNRIHLTQIYIKLILVTKNIILKMNFLFLD